MTRHTPSPTANAQDVTAANPFAFPSPEDDRPSDGYGMTLHDHLVGQSLAGLCSNPSLVDGGDLKAMKAQAEYVALMARMIADAALEYRTARA